MSDVTPDSIRHALASYALAVDGLDRERLGECFTAAADYVVRAADGATTECRGREEIVALNFDVASGLAFPRRHLVSNLVIDGVRAVSYLTVVELGETPGVVAVARVEDEFVADEGKARIARRVIDL